MEFSQELPAHVAVGLFFKLTHGFSLHFSCLNPSFPRSVQSWTLEKGESGVEGDGGGGQWPYYLLLLTLEKANKHVMK